MELIKKTLQHSLQTAVYLFFAFELAYLTFSIIISDDLDVLSIAYEVHDCLFISISLFSIMYMIFSRGISENLALVGFIIAICSLPGDDLPIQQLYPFQKLGIAFIILLLIVGNSLRFNYYNRFTKLVFLSETTANDAIIKFCVYNLHFALLMHCFMDSWALRWNALFIVIPLLVGIVIPYLFAGMPWFGNGTIHNSNNVPPPSQTLESKMNGA